MTKTSISMVSAVFAISAQLQGCTTPEPSRGDFMINQGASMVDIGVKWNEGSRLVQIGNDMIAEGRENVNEGTRLVNMGNKQINDGKNLVVQGKKLIEESEMIYRQRTSAEKPVRPQPEEAIEVFPLGE